MAEIWVDVIDGGLTGFTGVLSSRSGDRVLLQLSVFGRQMPVELRLDQVRLAGMASKPAVMDAVTESDAAMACDRIVAEHDRLAATEEFSFFLERIDAPDSDLAGEWDGYLAHRDQVRARVEVRKQVALDRFDRELGGLPVGEALRIMDGDAAFWLPGGPAAAQQRDRFPEPDAEQCLLATFFSEEAGDPGVSPRILARKRLDRARMAAEERDYQWWEANRSDDERRAGPSRGNPARYAYARAARHDVSLPRERGVELAIRAETGVSEGIGGHAQVPVDIAAGALAASTPTAGSGPTPDKRAAALLAEFHTIADDYVRKGRLERAMLAGRRLDLIQEIIRPSVSEGSTVVGVLLRDGAGDVPLATNPWAIPADAGLAAALTCVWGPVAQYAPRFVAAIHNRTLGLALLTEDDGAAALSYLCWHRDDDGSSQLINPPDSLDQFADPSKDYYLSTMIGAAPHIADLSTVVPLLAGPVPRPVRDFWSIHHGLHSFDGDWMLGGRLTVNTLEFFQNDSWSVAARTLGGLPPDRFVHSVGNGHFVDYVLDLDVLDSGGNPTVAEWAWKEWEVGGRKQFWDWLDSTGTDLILGP